VSDIIRSAGKTFDRSATQAATQAVVADTAQTRAQLAARRAQLSADLLGDAERLRAMLWRPFKHGEFGGKDNVWSEVSLPQPPVSAQRTILAAVHQAVKDHLDLERVDATSGTDDAVSMLTRLAEGIRAVHQAEEGSGDAGHPRPPDVPEAAREPGDE
jgi:hypothetical protein